MASSETPSWRNDLNFLSSFSNESSFFSNNSLLGASYENNDATELTFSPALTVVIAIVAGLMSTMTIVGNVLVITAFIIEKSLRKYSNYFILNLSIADLLIGILIPPYAPFLLQNYHWRWGRAACTVWLVLDYVVGSASVLCIVVISLDRYFLVSRGLKYVADQKVPRAICLMATVWIIAFINYAPAIVLWEFVAGKRTVKDGECQAEFHDNLVYLTLTACVEFFVPLVSICSLNLAVYLNIRKRSRGLIRSENPLFTIKDSATSAEKTSTAKVSSFTTNSTTATVAKQESIPIDQIKVLNETPKTKTGSIITTSASEYSGSSEEVAVVGTKSSLTTPVPKKNKTKKKSSIRIKFKLNRRLSKNAQEASNKKTTSDNLVIVPLLTDENGRNKITTTKNNPNNNNNNRNNNISNNANTIENLSPVHLSKKVPHVKKPATARTTLTKDKKAARSLFILVFVFVFCWAPYTFLTLIKAVCPTCINTNVYEFAFWLLWLNSTVNPILYPFLHVKFRKAFIKIFKLMLFCIKFKRKKYDPNKK